MLKRAEIVGEVLNDRVNAYLQSLSVAVCFKGGHHLSHLHALQPAIGQNRLQAVAGLHLQAFFAVDQ